MEKVFVRPCAVCGEPIEYTYTTKRRRYCSKCKEYMERSVRQESIQRKKDQMFIERRADKIAHQQDRSVWTPDYAERQKARTLEMLGPII